MSDLDLLEEAFNLIANAGEGNWKRESVEWQIAAEKFRDKYHERISSIRFAITEFVGQKLKTLAVTPQTEWDESKPYVQRVTFDPPITVNAGEQLSVTYTITPGSDLI